MSSIILITLWVVILPMLVFMSSGVHYQIPSSINVTLTDTAPVISPLSIAMSIATLEDQCLAHVATQTLGAKAKDEHIAKNMDMGGQATIWTSVPNFPLDWAGVQTFETMTRVDPRSTITVSPKGSSHNGNRQSTSLGSSVPKDPPTDSHVDDLKRSAGIFILIRAILISWAVVLVGMLSYMLARHAEEIFADDPYLKEAEPTEDHERTALLDEDTV